MEKSALYAARATKCIRMRTQRIHLHTNSKCDFNGNQFNQKNRAELMIISVGFFLSVSYWAVLGSDLFC